MNYNFMDLEYTPLCYYHKVNIIKDDLPVLNFL